MGKGILRFIRGVEKKSYPREYRALQHMTSMNDLVEYCEAIDVNDLIIETGAGWYFLAVKSTKEIVDLAGTMTLRDLHKIKKVIIDNFAGQVISLDARESTSYRLITRLGEVVMDDPYDWGGEIFHDVRIRVKEA